MVSRKSSTSIRFTFRPNVIFEISKKYIKDTKRFGDSIAHDDRSHDTKILDKEYQAVENLGHRINSRVRHSVFAFFILRHSPFTVLNMSQKIMKYRFRENHHFRLTGCN